MNNHLPSTISYKPCRILYYNSCKYTFFETHLDKNTILFGNNNAGKTSFLNGLQFFLLPEVNFNNIDNKFNFKKKYTSEDSFKYYFPTNHSFIIAEFENAFGRFLQVIFSGRNQLEYARIFTKESYESVREKLWDNETNQVKEINGTEFLDYLKGTHKARYVSKKEEIVNLIYSNDINSEENGRFALVPISPNNFKFENMKSIVKLAFNIDMLHEDDLKNIFINYIEGKFKNMDDIANIDFQKICREQEAYKKEQSHYVLIKNHESNYLNCNHHLKVIGDVMPKMFHNIQEYVNFYKAEEARYATESVNYNNSIKYFEEQLGVSKSKYGAKSREVNELNTEVNMLKAQIAIEQGNQKKYMEIKNRPEFADKSYSEICSFFEEKDANLLKSLEMISDKERITGEITRLSKKISALKSDNTAMKAEIQDTSDVKFAFNQLPAEQVQFFRSMIKSHITVEHTLDDEEKAALDGFFKLVKLNKEGTHYSLFNRYLCNVLGTVDVENNLKLIKENEEHIVQLEKEIETKQSYLNNDISKNKENITNERNKVKTDLNIVRRYSDQETVIAEKEEEVATKLELLEKDREALVHLEEAYKKNSNSLTEKRNGLAQLHHDEKAMVDNYNLICIKAAPLGIDMNLDVNPAIPVTITALTRAMVDDLVKDFTTSNNSKQAIKNELKVFVSQGLLDDSGNHIVMTDLSANEMKHIVRDKIEPLYEHLAENRENLDVEMKRSFSAAFSTCENILDYRSHIQECIRAFNKKLVNTAVSNFDCISVNVNFDMRFDDFSDTYKNTNSHDLSDENIDDFFIKLRQFMERFKITNKITTKDILKSVNIQFHKDGFIERKSQSNGTSIMANSVILSQLKNEFIQGDKEKSIFSYFLPIIVDEVSNIDSSNLRTLKEFLIDKDLIMFCATPTPSISVDDNYDIMISLSAHGNHKVFDPNRNIVHFLPENIKIEKIDFEGEEFGEMTVEGVADAEL